jgi:hypothetical protein
VVAEPLTALSPDWWGAVASVLGDDGVAVDRADLVVHEGDESGGSHHLLWQGPTLLAWRPGAPSRAPDLRLVRSAPAAVDDLLARVAPADTMTATTVRLPTDGRSRDVLGLPLTPVWPWPDAAGRWQIRWWLRCPDSPFGHLEVGLEVGPPAGWSPSLPSDTPPDVDLTLRYDDLLAWTSGRTFLGPVLDLGAATGDVALLSAIEGTVSGEARRQRGESMPDVLPLVRYRSARTSAETQGAFDSIDASTS